MISLLCGLDSGVRLLLSSAMLLCLYTYFSTKRQSLCDIERVRWDG